MAKPVDPPAQDLHLGNRQRTRGVNLDFLARVLRRLLVLRLPRRPVDFTIHLVGPVEMARLNQAHLGHEGPTDVITLDYAGAAPALAGGAVTGEAFICVAVAVTQAAEFGAPWECELVRYCVHALLHLQGFDDLSPAPRRRMKAAENRLVRQLGREFDLSQVGREPTLPRE